MKKILILFAHPKFEESRANSILVNAVKDLEGVTFRDLYESYPAANIDVDIEQALLKEHDVIIWHHPIYWYSCPPLMKQWIDEVLEYNWAYGSNGNELKGKTCLSVVTTGGVKETYKKTGYHGDTLRQFMKPFEQIIRICKMNYLPPFSVMGVKKLSDEDLMKEAKQYIKLIELLKQDNSINYLNEVDCINDIPELKIN